MAVEANKVLARRIFEEFFGNEELNSANELIAPDFVDHNPLPGQPAGPEGVKWVNRALHAAHSELRFVVEDLIAERDKVAVRWTLTGINTGSMLGVPPSGQRVSEQVIVVFRVANGKIAERWAGFAR